MKLENIYNLLDNFFRTTHSHVKAIREKWDSTNMRLDDQNKQLKRIADALEARAKKDAPPPPAWQGP